MYKNVHVIINPASGQPQPILNTINKVFHEHEVNWDISVTTIHQDGTQLTKQAIENGADLIVACGGDGTVKEVINGLVDHDVPLALLQGGTGNAMACNLSIPRDLEQATALITGEHTLRAVDIGKLHSENDKDKVGYFILRMSAGLQPKILKTANRDLKDRFGNLAYVIASVQELSTSKAQTFKLVVDGEEIETEGVTCMIANSATVGGNNPFEFAPNVDTSDGLLDVYVFDTKLESIIAMMNSTVGQDEKAYPYHWKGKDITISMDSTESVTIDGEPFGETPVHVSVVPNAVKIIVPKSE